MKISIPVGATESVSHSRGRQRISYSEQHRNHFWEYNYFSDADTAAMPTTHSLRDLLNKTCQRLQLGYVGTLHDLKPFVSVRKKYTDIIEFSFIGYGLSKYDAEGLLDCFDDFMFRHAWGILRISRYELRPGVYEIVVKLQHREELSNDADSLYDPDMHREVSATQEANDSAG